MTAPAYLLPPPLPPSQGGPGCSSLEGAFQESGPLWTTSGGTNLQVNQYSYNNFSHQLFLEAPACVGFSYADSTNPSGCTREYRSAPQHAVAHRCMRPVV